MCRAPLAASVVCIASVLRATGDGRPYRGVGMGRKQNETPRRGFRFIEHFQASPPNGVLVVIISSRVVLSAIGCYLLIKEKNVNRSDVALI